MTGTNAGASILVVDDEPSIVDSVATVLGYEGFATEVAYTGRAALTKAQEGRFDLIILDVMLPDLDGFEVTRHIRADGLSVPVLFLSARSEVDDRIEGLMLGGDDYVAKPFSLMEVVARVKVILRRRETDTADVRLRYADLSMDEESHEVWRGDTPVGLTATEFSLLRLFLLNPRRVLSKERIIDHVWHYDFNGNVNIVETYVRYLRRKLDALGPPLIHTIRLVGYVLRDEQRRDVSRSEPDCSSPSPRPPCSRWCSPTSPFTARSVATSTRRPISSSPRPNGRCPSWRPARTTVRPVRPEPPGALRCPAPGREPESSAPRDGSGPPACSSRWSTPRVRW